ncbi:glycosyltransferase family 39 protein [Candidatus Entotheonella palauensis]|uniref:glycosyltransferase family 39 protein n=1 Tax=Candidatus Entotheonella palauensis TaxID=93172 RepID=UPI000B7F2840|nr:glycosyltransferase family 39 protein [Candidatus Entotheonella palauensis]
MQRHSLQDGQKPLTGTATIASRPPLWASFLLLAILGLAFGIRVWGIGFGLPHEITYEQLTYEEVKEVHRAFKLAAGEYTWAFGKGGLYYLLFLEYGVFYVLSWILGWVKNTQDFALWALRDRMVFFLIGRVTVALLGTLTCLVIYKLSERFFDWRTALGTALIGATAYYHALFSSVINVDIGMVLALYSSVLAYCQYERTQQRKWLVVAGILGGVAGAFKLPGLVILPLLCAAIWTCRETWAPTRRRLQDMGWVLVTLLVTLTAVAPEWLSGFGILQREFAFLFGAPAAQTTEQVALFNAVEKMTVKSSSPDTLSYVDRLFQPQNIVLFISACIGACIGLWQRQRWDIIWAVLIIVFLGVMSLGSRGQPERYMLPIFPALWLLSSRALAAVSQRHWTAMAVGLLCIVMLPSAMLVRHAHEKTQPDTRLLAKAWIETHIPSGAKLLLDGTRYRFIQSPPLQPDPSTVDRLSRRVTDASDQGMRVGRGVSKRALSLYQQAMKDIDGPTYELHSTVFGIQVKDLQYYVQNCFDYVITSSYITRRVFNPNHQARFAKSIEFYQQLEVDPRFRPVYEAKPVRWQSSGPVIKVYEVDSACRAQPPQSRS